MIKSILAILAVAIIAMALVLDGENDASNLFAKGTNLFATKKERGAERTLMMVLSIAGTLFMILVWIERVLNV